MQDSILTEILGILVLVRTVKIKLKWNQKLMLAAGQRLSVPLLDMTWLRNNHLIDIFPFVNEKTWVVFF